MQSNPFVSSNTRSTPTQQSPAPERRTDWRIFEFAIIILPVLFGSFGFIFYIVCVLFLDQFVMPFVETPKYTYYFETFITSSVITTLIGAFAGFSLSFCFVGYARTTALAVILVAFLGAAATRFAWRNLEIEGCTSAIDIYGPNFGFCTILVLLGILLFFGKSSFLKDTGRS